MSTAAARAPFLQSEVFEDGLGKRYQHRLPASGDAVELLQLREEFCTDAFELALRERLALLNGFQRSCFARVHAVQRSTHTGPALFVVAEAVSGERLSTLLAGAQERRLAFDLNARLCLVRQLVTAIALLHEKMPQVAHGAIGLERVVISSTGHLMVADHVLGAALAELHYDADRYWKTLRIALPPGPQPPIDQRADAMQIGIVALELMLGRAIDLQDYPDRLSDLIEEAWSVPQPPPAKLRVWLLRLLQFGDDAAFSSAVDAWVELERVLGTSPETASLDALQSFMATYEGRPQPTPTASTAATSPAPAIASAPASRPQPSLVVAAAPPVAPAEKPVVLPPAPQPAPKMKSPAPPPQPASPPPVSRASEPTSTPTRRFITEAPVRITTSSSSRRWYWIAGAAVVIALAIGGVLFGRWYLVPAAAAEAPGTLVVTTNPAGVAATVDGQPRGVTPLTLELAAGAHKLELATDAGPRVIPFTLTAGGTVSQSIDVPKAAPMTGQLEVRSEPAGARVTIDGTPSGTTPAAIQQLSPGVHSVVLQSDVTSVTQEVTITAGATASLVVPMAQQGALSGWVSVDAPAEVQVFEDTRLLGTSRSDRIMLLAGKHELTIVNEALGYRATKTTTVSPGKVAAIRLDWPKGAMALNAQPWAEVWVDGEKKGETPIGNVAVPIGAHEVVFRHPELGERTVQAVVTATTPARVSVDMRKP